MDGLNDIMVQFGQCCSPIPGDNIVGYLTKGKGVTVHRSSCKSITHFKNQDRFMNVEWDIASNRPFIVRLKMIFEDRKNLLNDLTDSTSLLNINIKSGDMSAKDGVATCLMILEVRNLTELDALKKKIVESINPIKIERV